MDILGLLSKTKTSNRFVILIIVRGPKLTGMVPTKRTTADHIAEVVLDAWIMLWGIPELHLADNRPQLALKIFNTAFLPLEIQLLTITAYHPPKYWQAEQFN